GDSSIPLSGDDVAAVECGVNEVASTSEAVALLDSLAASDEPLPVMAAFDGDAVAGLALVTTVAEDNGEATWIPGSMLGSPSGGVSGEHSEVLDALRKLFGPHGRPLQTHDAKQLMRALL